MALCITSCIRPMLLKIYHSRQVSIPKNPILHVFVIVLFAGCQATLSPPESARTSPIIAAATQKKSIKSPRSMPARGSQPREIASQKVESPATPPSISEESLAPTRPVTRALELPDTLSDWRIRPSGSNQWQASPTRRPPLVKSASLMQDAIITSAIHQKIQSIPGLRRLALRHNTRAGIARIQASQLTREQAILVLDNLITLDSIREIHLSTQLLP